jgi:beta-glucanase (GH16 family)
MVWNDEFDGNALNTDKWSYEVDCWGGGNGELQCYTARPQNTIVQNGILTMKAIQERYTGTQADCTRPDGCTNTKDYTSSRLRTVNDPTASWLYGRMEMKAKLPDGKHLWPAFWMLPTDYKYGTWAASGEVDIMEYRGQIKNKVEGTLHFGGVWPNNRYQGSGPITFPFSFSDAFHTFAVEWEMDEVRWYVDDTMYHKMNLVRSFYSGVGPNPYTANRQPFEQRFHILLNLAIGGGFFPAGTYGTLSAQDAQQWVNPTYQIDFIRVYQRQSNATTSPPSLVNTPSASPVSSASPTSSPAPSLLTSSSHTPIIATSTPQLNEQSDLVGSDTDDIVVAIPTTTIQQLPSSQGAIGAEDDALQGSSQSGNILKMTSTLEYIIGGAGGVLLLLLIAVTILIILRVKKMRARSESQTDLLTTPRRTEQGLDVPGSRGSLPFSVSIEKGRSSLNVMRPTVGSRCRALFSGDGKYYDATIEETIDGKYLVNYGAVFGGQKEWVTSILL